MLTIISCTNQVKEARNPLFIAVATGLIRSEKKEYKEMSFAHVVVDSKHTRTANDIYNVIAQKITCPNIA